MFSEQLTASPSYFDPELGTQVVKLLPGEFFASADAGTAITTLLGSCVSVCLYDRTRGIGGMNHFMLPEVWHRTTRTRCGDPGAGSCSEHCSARYGSCAMQSLIWRLEQLGAKRCNLEAKLFGAGRVLARMTDIGERNAAFALGYLEERGIPVVAKDLGDRCPRRIAFFPTTGRVLVRRLRDVPAGIS